MKLKQNDNILEIQQLHQEICSLAVTALEKAFRIGELLVQEKTKLKYGEWIPWIEKNIPFTRTAATSYMRCYRHKHLFPNDRSGDHLSVREFLRLCAAPTPEEKKEIKNEIDDKDSEIAKAEAKIQVIEREKDILEAELEVIVQDEDFSDDIEHVVEEIEDADEAILAKRKELQQRLRDEIILREEVSEKQLIKHAGEYWDHLLIHFSKWDKKRLAKLTIQFLLQKYPQLNDEGI